MLPLVKAREDELKVIPNEAPLGMSPLRDPAALSWEQALVEAECEQCAGATRVASPCGDSVSASAQ